MTNAAPANLDTCLLLTDGAVMCHQYNSNVWHRLSPDAFGSYKNGTWDSPPIAPMPNGNDPNIGCVNCAYTPLYYASAVLKDGRAIVIGGEYNGGGAVDTNIGFIYDPTTDSWSNQLQDVFGGGNVGDAHGKVLQDGTFVLANINSTNMESLNPSTGVFTAKNPTGKLDVNSEENWNMLYDGTILTVDSRIASKFERYTLSSNSWGNSGATPVNLADTGGGTVANSSEVGPCSLRPDNKLFCFSGNSLGQNALYNPSTNTWSHAAAMDFPAATGGGHFSMADGAAAALPNGNILVMASPVTNATTFNSPSHFYEVTLATNTLTAVTDSPHAASFAAYQGRMLVLPTGEVLLTAYDQAATQDVMLYSNGGVPSAASRPIITAAPTVVSAGGTFNISGKQISGFSEGAAYGDDAQSATNYPLVRITSQATGHVSYARSSNHSRMGVASVGSTTVVTTSFRALGGLEVGAASLEVVANGIASSSKAITIAARSACQRASDDYGIVANVTFGFAPQDVQTWWVANNCNTTPVNAITCQTASNYFGIVANVTFGFAPQDVQTWWVANNCGTSPQGPASTCQRASDDFGITANVTFGFAPQDVQTWWVANNCNTTPTNGDTCQTASNYYGITANVTFGFAPQDLQTWWVANGCGTVPNN